MPGRRSVTKYFMDKYRCMAIGHNQSLNIAIVAESNVTEVISFLEGVDEKQTRLFEHGISEESKL